MVATIEDVALFVGPHRLRLRGPQPIDGGSLPPYLPRPVHFGIMRMLRQAGSVKVNVDFGRQRRLAKGPSHPRMDENRAFAFGHFVLIPARRELRGDTGVFPVASRTLDILITLVTRHPEIVSKNELLSAVW